MKSYLISLVIKRKPKKNNVTDTFHLSEKYNDKMYSEGGDQRTPIFTVGGNT